MYLNGVKILFLHSWFNVYLNANIIFKWECLVMTVVQCSHEHFCGLDEEYSKPEYSKPDEYSKS